MSELSVEIHDTGGGVVHDFCESVTRYIVNSQSDLSLKNVDRKR
jgi:hypothetical protein